MTDDAPPVHGRGHRGRRARHPVQLLRADGSVLRYRHPVTPRSRARPPRGDDAPEGDSRTITVGGRRWAWWISATTGGSGSGERISRARSTSTGTAVAGPARCTTGDPPCTSRTRRAPRAPARRRVADRPERVVGRSRRYSAPRAAHRVRRRSATPLAAAGDGRRPVAVDSEAGAHRRWTSPAAPPATSGDRCSPRPAGRRDPQRDAYRAGCGRCPTARSSPRARTGRSRPNRPADAAERRTGLVRDRPEAAGGGARRVRCAGGKPRRAPRADERSRPEQGRAEHLLGLPCDEKKEHGCS